MVNVFDLNPYAPPQATELPMPLPASEVWRDGEMVVVRPDGTLPAWCVKCGKPCYSDALAIVQILSARRDTDWVRLLAIISVAVLFAAIAFAAAISLPDRALYVLFGTVVCGVLGALLWYYHSQKKLPHTRIEYFLCTFHRRWMHGGWIGVIWIPLYFVLAYTNPSSWMIVGFVAVMSVISHLFSSFTFHPIIESVRDNDVWVRGIDTRFRDHLPALPKNPSPQEN